MFADRVPDFVQTVYWQYADSVPTCVAYLAVSASLMGNLFAFSPFRLFTILRKHHDFTFSHFHIFTFDENTTISHFHIFTLSISRNDAVALYLAPDGNHLTAVAVAAWAA